MRKILIFFVLFSVYWYSLQASPKPPTSVLAPAPISPDNHHFKVCKAIWDKEGTVCSGKKLLAFTQAVHDATKPRKLTGLPSDVALNQGKVGGSGDHSRNLWFSMNNIPTFNVDVKAILARYHKIRGQTTVFKSTMGQCWAYMTHARDVSLCYSCSAQSAKYFYKKKALVTENECNRMLDACLPFFRISITIVSESGSEGVSFHLFGHNHNRQNGNVVKELHDAIERAQIKKLVQEYDTGKGKVKQSKADQLCLKLFRLYKQPLFEVMDGVVNKIKTALDNKIHGRQLSNWGQIGTDSFSNDPFSGDVSILKLDGSGNSLIQASTGMISIPHGANYQAMNLSLAFP